MGPAESTLTPQAGIEPGPFARVSLQIREGNFRKERSEGTPGQSQGEQSDSRWAEQTARVGGKGG